MYSIRTERILKSRSDKAFCKLFEQFYLIFAIVNSIFTISLCCHLSTHHIKSIICRLTDIPPSITQ